MWSCCSPRRMPTSWASICTALGVSRVRSSALSATAPWGAPWGAAAGAAARALCRPAAAWGTARKTWVGVGVGMGLG